MGLNPLFISDIGPLPYIFAIQRYAYSIIVFRVSKANVPIRTRVCGAADTVDYSSKNTEVPPKLVFSILSPSLYSL
jgi:hypothetical protein